jgi:hypothetical protein
LVVNVEALIEACQMPHHVFIGDTLKLNGTCNAVNSPAMMIQPSAEQNSDTAKGVL